MFFLIIIFYTLIFFILSFIKFNNFYDKGISNYFFSLKKDYLKEKNFFFLRLYEYDDKNFYTLLEIIYHKIFCIILIKIKDYGHWIIFFLYINFFFLICSYIHYKWVLSKKNKIFILFFCFLIISLLNYLEIFIIIGIIYLIYIHLILLLILLLSPNDSFNYTNSFINIIFKYLIGAAFKIDKFEEEETWVDFF